MLKNPKFRKKNHEQNNKNFGFWPFFAPKIQTYYHFTRKNSNMWDFLQFKKSSILAQIIKLSKNLPFSLLSISGQKMYFWNTVQEKQRKLMLINSWKQQFPKKNMFYGSERHSIGYILNPLKPDYAHQYYDVYRLFTYLIQNLF